MMNFDPVQSSSARSTKPAPAATSSKSNAAVDIDIDMNAAAPKLSREELAAKREGDIDDKVRVALENKRGVSAARCR